MAEVLVEYPDVIPGDDGKDYRARACAAEVSANSWQGWIEFESTDGESVTRSPRETTQPNRTDTLYWATGITPVYLEGALRRALHPLELRSAPPPRPPAFDAPADAVVHSPATPAAEAVLDPFAVYAKSETLLRRQLLALSAWHLANIVRSYGIATDGDPNRMGAASLIEAIVAAARVRSGVPLPD